MQSSQTVGRPIQTFSSCLYRDTRPLLCFLRGFACLTMVGILPKVSYPNSQYTPQTSIYLEGNLVLNLIQLHQITEEWKTTVTIVSTVFRWLVDNGETDELLDSIVQWMSMVWLWLFLNRSKYLSYVLPLHQQVTID